MIGNGKTSTGHQSDSYTSLRLSVVPNLLQKSHAFYLRLDGLKSKFLLRNELIWNSISMVN